MTRLKTKNMKILKTADSILSDVTAVQSKQPSNFIDVSNKEERKELDSPDHPLLHNNAINGIIEKDL